MPTINSIAKVVAKPLPRVISRKTQAILDYLLVGSFLGTASWFWRHNKRAAVAALLCGGAKLAVTLLTDSPGGVRKVISPHARREIDPLIDVRGAAQQQPWARVLGDGRDFVE